MQLTKTMLVELARRKQSVACVVLALGHGGHGPVRAMPEGTPGMPACPSPDPVLRSLSTAVLRFTLNHWPPLASRERDAVWGSLTRTGLRQATTAASAGAGAGRVELVQGASRGLGLKFVRQLLERPDHRCQAAVQHRGSACSKPALCMRRHGSQPEANFSAILDTSWSAS